MTKKILVIDTDGWTGCSECPAFNITGAGIRTCQASKNGYCENRRIYTKSKIPDWCPLKELPEPEINSYITDEDWECLPDDYEVSTAYALGHQDGFNECLKEITED